MDTSSWRRRDNASRLCQAVTQAGSWCLSCRAVPEYPSHRATHQARPESHRWAPSHGRFHPGGVKLRPRISPCSRGESRQLESLGF